jgi:hypothetical protein
VSAVPWGLKKCRVGQDFLVLYWKYEQRVGSAITICVICPFVSVAQLYVHGYSKDP